MKDLKIYDDNKKIIRIKSVEDLHLLPDKSIKILFDNQTYMITLYLYILYRIDGYLQVKNYSNKTRVRYFNLCIKNLDSFIEYEKEYLKNSSTVFVIKSEKFPKNLTKVYRDSVISICNFFRGMLSTTSLLDKKLFSREDKQTIRHNYGNMISILLNSIE